MLQCMLFFFLKRYDCFEALYTVVISQEWLENPKLELLCFQTWTTFSCYLKLFPPLFPKGNHDNIVIEGRTKLSRKITKKRKIKAKKKKHLKMVVIYFSFSFSASGCHCYCEWLIFFYRSNQQQIFQTQH